jgi:rubrerythrin
MEKVVNLNDIQVLEKCRRLEEVAAEMYHFLARAHTSDPQISELWEKTAREEENHASQFSLAIRMKKGLSVEIKVGKTNVEETLKMAESILEGMKKNPPRIGKALEDVIMLEEIFSEFHLDNTMCFPDESHKKLFQAMMSADKDHVGSLKKALANLKG